jgi:GDP-L-fucose synthase
VAGARRLAVLGSDYIPSRREFLHVDDLARACVRRLERYDADEPINVGDGEGLTVADLATLIADVVGFDGSIECDETRPDGTPRKLLDVGPIRALSWTPLIGLRDGVTTTHSWFVADVLDRT